MSQHTRARLIFALVGVGGLAMSALSWGDDRGFALVMLAVSLVVPVVAFVGISRTERAETQGDSAR